MLTAPSCSTQRRVSVSQPLNVVLAGQLSHHLETRRLGGAKVVGPVVVGPSDRPYEGLVLVFHTHGPSAGAWNADHLVPSEAVHVLEAALNAPDAFVRLAVLLFVARGHPGRALHSARGRPFRGLHNFRLAGSRGGPERTLREELAGGVVEEGPSLVVVHDGAPVVELRLHEVLPQVEGLLQMRIGVNNLVPFPHTYALLGRIKGFPAWIRGKPTLSCASCQPRDATGESAFSDALCERRDRGGGGGEGIGGHKGWRRTGPVPHAHYPLHFTLSPAVQWQRMEQAAGLLWCVPSPNANPGVRRCACSWRYCWPLLLS